MIRVLYVGAANLAQPTSGLDLASCAHFDELAADPRLDLTAISVSAVPLPAGPAPRPSTQLFAGDMLAQPGAGGRWREKLGLLARFGVLFHSGFTSRAARAAVRDALAAAPDVVVIDNKSALANLPLPRLLGLRWRRRTRIVIVAHDASADVLRDQATVAPTRLRALALRLHAGHLHLFETIALALAHRVVFLSAADRARFHLPAAKAITLCPLLDEPVRSNAVDDAPAAPDLVFLGSPAFFANAVAIDWIVERFAPELARLRPELRILLVGKGTDRVQEGCPANVTGLGFVHTDELHRRLGGAAGLLSPVVHGSGIKIKVLEALACGCPVFATAASLRGYEFMALEPLLDVADPAGSARRVAAIAADPVRLAAYRTATAASWARFRSDRRGKLADAVIAAAS